MLSSKPTTHRSRYGPHTQAYGPRSQVYDSHTPVVAVNNLDVDRGGVQVIHDLTFSASRGERLTITGHNGAGKTTLLSTILGILPATAGSVLIHRMRVGSVEWRHNRHIVGYVSQHAVRTDFPISAFEVVAIGLSGGARYEAHGGGRKRLSRKDKRRLMHEAMEMTGCAHLADAAYARLSGGQRQRVSIARCLCQRPQILLLDEPTASLDPEGKETLLELADSLSESLGITVLMVTHESAQFVRPGWRRLALESGRLAGDEPAARGETTPGDEATGSGDPAAEADDRRTPPVTHAPLGELEDSPWKDGGPWR